MSQIKFFKPNKIDLSNENITLTVTDSAATSTGSDIIDFIRNRNNRSAWITTGSADSGTTTIEIDMGDTESVDNIILIKHNWGSFTIQYWDGFAYTDFSTAINETTNTDETTAFSFTQVATSKIKIVINGTQTADVDKELYQLIIGEQLGQLEAYPIIKPKHVAGKKANKTLSGKFKIVEPVGRFSCVLDIKYLKSAADINVIESLYFDRLPYLVWLGAGNETQFSVAARGYRKEDIYLMRTTNDYRPDWYKGVYSTGLKLKIALDEVID